MKNLLASLLILSSILTANAQKFYLGISSGYAFGLSQNKSLSSEDNVLYQYSSASDKYTNKSTRVSDELGNGVHLNFFLGFQFNQHLSLETGFEHSFNHTAKTSFSNKEFIDDVFSNDQLTNIKLNSSYNAISLGMRVNQSVWKGNFYSRFGLLISSFDMNTEMDGVMHFSSFPYKRTTNMTAQYTTATSIGGYLGIGYEYEIIKKLFLFGDVKMNIQPVKLETGEITKFEIDGKDQLSSMSTSFKKTEFVDTTVETEAASDPDKPSKSSNTMMNNFNNVSFQVGVRFVL